MKDNFTISWSFRNRIDELKKSIETADATCPKTVDFCLVDASSDEDVIQDLRKFASSIQNRIIRICESTYRSSLAEAWNMGIFMTDNRYIIISSVDCFFSNGWFEVVKDKLLGGVAYLYLGDESIIGMDKKVVITKIGWFDEEYIAGPHFDRDHKIRASEARLPVMYIPNNGLVLHGCEADIWVKRLKGDPSVKDKLPMNEETNEIIFKNKWETSWPGWKSSIDKGVDRFNLPDPPGDISRVKRKRSEVDPHPLITQKYRKL